VLDLGVVVGEAGLGDDLDVAEAGAVVISRKLKPALSRRRVRPTLEDRRPLPMDSCVEPGPRLSGCINVLLNVS